MWNRNINTLSILLILGFSSLKAQEKLTLEGNMIQGGDSLVKECVPYISSGSDGEDAVWDFSDLEPNNTYFIKYVAEGDTAFCSYDTKNICRYKKNNNCLELVEVESSLLSMDYHSSKPLLPLPLTLNQTYNKNYCGEGLYCGKYHERIIGMSKVKADAEGTLILSEEDTLYHALRVYHLATESIRLNADSCQNDSDNLKQIITEHYQWYCRGFRYPVFETICSSTYDNLTLIATKQYAYRCMPAFQRTLKDSINQEIRNTEEELVFHSKVLSEESASGLTDNKDIFTYQVLVEGSLVKINYDLKESAYIHAMIVDIMGMLHRDERQYSDAGVGKSMHIDCSGLRRGQYIIYINVNGIIYNKIIALK